LFGTTIFLKDIAWTNSFKFVDWEIFFDLFEDFAGIDDARKKIARIRGTEIYCFYSKGDWCLMIFSLYVKRRISTRVFRMWRTLQQYQRRYISKCSRVSSAIMRICIGLALLGIAETCCMIFKRLLISMGTNIPLYSLVHSAE